MTHSYDYHCGCASCCRAEAAMEREAEYADNQTDILATLPAFIAEACFNEDEDEAKAIAVGLEGRDYHGVGRLLEKMLRRSAKEAVADYNGDNDADSVDRLINLYMSEEE